jgi:hypothetical protein
MFLGVGAGRRHGSLRLPEQSVMSADWREIEFAVRRGNAHCSCSSQPIQLCDHINQLSYISVGQHCNLLHTAEDCGSSLGQDMYLDQFWILYLIIGKQELVVTPFTTNSFFFQWLDSPLGA